MEGRVDVYPYHPKGGDARMSYDSMMVMLTFGLLIVGLIGLIIVIIKSMKKIADPSATGTIGYLHALLYNSF